MNHLPDRDPQQALALLRRHFLCREDVLAFMASWDKPCPTQEGTDLDALLAAHVRGETASKAGVRYRNRYGTGAELGWFRVGAYTPALDGTTKWLCLDFDGSGHAEALADPKAAALAVHQAFTKAGLPAYLELSGGGKGWHLWCFFDPPVPAKLARALAFALLPAEVTLANGEVVQANTGRVIEVFPKQTKIEDNGYGNLVWLPWWWKAEWSANQFHRLNDAGELSPYLPDSFDTASTKAVEAIVDTSRAEAKEQRKQEKQQATERSWQEWRGRALGALPLEAVYGEWLTGKRHKTGWLECRDPWSPSGDRDPSAGVADGTGEAERGQFHSFISGKSLSAFDFLIERGLASDFRAAREKVAELSGISLSDAVPKQASSGLPEINVNNRQLRDIIDDAWQALLSANDPPVLFRRRDGTLAHIRRNEDACQGPQGAWMESAEERFVNGLLLRRADWVKRQEKEVSAARPPREVAGDMLALPDRHLPVLTEVIGAPVFGREGRLIDTPGYHADERLWYEPSGPLDLSGLPEHPTAQQLAAAKSLLIDDLLVDFPFVGESERAHALAVMIQPAVRRMIAGPTPAYLVEAPRIASGKGMLCNLVSVVHTGEECHVTTLPRDDDEARKRITAELALGRPIILLDNADEKRQLHYPSLAAVLTASSWSDRLLGESQMLSLPNRATWLLTANNPSLSLELARRCVRIRIDPRMEQPWWRTGFKHDPLMGWAKEHRSELLSAVLTIIRAWIAAGRPLHKKRMGSFEHWSAVIGGILEVAEIPGFLGHLEELYQFADAQGSEWRQFATAWWEVYGERQVSARFLLELALERDLLGTVIGDKSLRSQQSLLGRGLSSIRDQQIGEWRVHVSYDSHNKSASYRLSEADPRGTCGTMMRDIEGESPASEIVPATLFESPGESAGHCGTSVPPLTREADDGVRDTHTHARAHTRIGEPLALVPQSPANREDDTRMPSEADSPRDMGGQCPADKSRMSREAEGAGPAEITDLAELPDEWEQPGDETSDRPETGD
ncbi:MAG: hypothetical protein ACE149_17530 [Armatimonadota bacterium]